LDRQERQAAIERSRAEQEAAELKAEAQDAERAAAVLDPDNPEATS
jgi:hypothetical protein